MTKLSSLEWKFDWPSAVVGLMVGAIVAWVLSTSWMATVLVRDSTALSSENAMRIQTQNIAAHMLRLYSSQGRLPDGDLTAVAIATKAFNPTTPDIMNWSSPMNVRDRDAMARLHVDESAKRITNEFGGVVQVHGRGGAIRIIYTKVPKGVCATGAECQS